MATELHMDGFVARAARALSQVSIDLVAQRAGIEPEKLKAYERGLGSVTTEEAQALVVAFDYYGVLFIPEGDGRGPGAGVGVRRKFGHAKVEMIENWEGEGGPVGEDDI
ncbi:XRE family transcriptional regulator [Dietzia sp.]|uniref:XRE family transcriptional regulator n=1 Tax=Dietzia sp. TaxID=1871616 RepID=UPI002FD96A61